MLSHVQLARGGAWWLGEAPPATPAAGGPEPPDFPTLQKNGPDSDSTHTQNERRVAQICPRVCPHAIHEPRSPLSRLEQPISSFYCRPYFYDPRSAIQNRMCPNAAHWPFGSIGSTLAHFLCEKSRLAAASTKIESGVLLQRVCRTWTQNGLFIAHTSKNRCAQTNRDQKIAQDT